MISSQARLGRRCVHDLVLAIGPPRSPSDDYRYKTMYGVGSFSDPLSSDQVPHLFLMLGCIDPCDQPRRDPLHLGQVPPKHGLVLGPPRLINPLFVPILIAGFVPGFITQYRTGRVVHEARLKHATGDRLLQRLGTILTDRNAAAELRLFGNGPDLVRRWSDARRRRDDDVLVAEQAKFRASVLGEIGVFAGIAISLIIIVRMLIDQRTPIGSWVTVLVGLEFMLGTVYGLAMTARNVREDSAFLSDFFAFEDEADAIIARHRREQGSITSSARIADGRATDRAMRIVANNVSFSYPDAEHPVVRDVSLTLEAGERVAIVGENGAGKSTLVRLLTGLYTPSAGTVTLDGVDTVSADAEQLRSQIGAVFQDYVPWQMTARENVGMSDLGRIGDDDALKMATDRAGILDLIDDLPDGFDSWLGRQFGERDISGGQWQRIALARAFFRESRFLVMDEPTAALDPLAEQRLFERFSSLAEGKTALTISHRLGPARFADRVIVMNGGRIVESGHHNDLMVRNGPYAKMFRAQAEWYRDAPVHELTHR